MKAVIACTACAVLALAGVGATTQELPGSSVAVEEASQLVGGGCVGMYARPCGTPACNLGSVQCLDPAGPKAKPQGSACDLNCSAWLYGSPCTGTGG